MFKKTRSDKKNTTCERCGRTLSTPQKLREHFERENPCPFRNIIQKQNLISAKVNSSHGVSVSGNNEVLTDNNTRKSNETVKQWGSRLRKRYKEITYENYDLPKNLAECKKLYNDLIQIDPDVIRDNKQELLDDEFQRLSNITGDNEENLIFREQQLGLTVKRRAVAVHNAKVPRYHPDNGGDIRKMLESQRKSFKELLEKEFDKRGQFKFALCSLTKFLLDDKPGDEKKSTTRRD
ncbi:hypothetical protein Glove_115g97 [Diversispora epigaea]|uniref:Uncharacterized protein n=1 Tax=Diversispora epigaea TaxID=1348612 RepID=A0A397J109_9GLOM|nr:hypothetical protein Glove_115g97 [Diversispora epigaea]